MSSLYKQEHITYDPLYGCYFYKGKKLTEDQHKKLKHKIILDELNFKIQEDFSLCYQSKALLSDLINEASIYNDLRDQRAIVYKRYKRLVEYIFENYEIKPIKSNT